MEDLEYDLNQLRGLGPEKIVNVLHNRERRSRFLQLFYYHVGEFRFDIDKRVPDCFMAFASFRRVDIPPAICDCKNGRKRSIRKKKIHSECQECTQVKDAVIATELGEFHKRIEENHRNLCELVFGTFKIEKDDHCAAFNILSSYTMIDPSLKEVKLFRGCVISDNAFFKELGKSSAKSWVLRRSFAAANGMDAANGRYGRMIVNACSYWSVWAGDVSADSIPVIWPLYDETHKVQDAGFLKQAEMRIMGDMPFILIGLLDYLRFYEHRDNFIESFELYRP